MGQLSTYWSEVDGPVLHGTRGNAATTAAVRDTDHRSSVGWNPVRCLVGAAKNSVSSQGSLRAIEQRRFGWIIRPLGPIVVGLITFVTALVAKRLLVGIGEVPVPRQEVTRVVDGEGLANVCCDEVVETVLASWADGLWKFRREFRQALNGLDVVFLLSSGECRPKLVSMD